MTKMTITPNDKKRTTEFQKDNKGTKHVKMTEMAKRQKCRKDKI